MYRGGRQALATPWYPGLYLQIFDESSDRLPVDRKEVGGHSVVGQITAETFKGRDIPFNGYWALGFCLATQAESGNQGVQFEIGLAHGTPPRKSG